MRPSLRSRLMIGIAATTLLVLIASTAIVDSLIRRSLTAEFDQLLGAKARALAAMIEQDGDRVDIEFAEHPLPEFARSVRPEYYEVWRGEGTVLAKSRRLEGADLPQVNGSSGSPGIRRITLPDGRAGRVVGIQFLPRVDREPRDPSPWDPANPGIEDFDAVDDSKQVGVSIAVARDTSDLDKTLARIFGVLCGSGLVTVALIVGVLAWLVTHNLRPVHELALQIGRMDEKSLASRVHVANAPQELAPVVSRLNELIDRLESAFEREKTLTADIAHELRTPLSGIRSTLEVSLSRQRDAEGYRDAMRKCLVICDQIQPVVATLLSLARIEANRENVDSGCVDMELVLQKCWKQFEHRAHERRLNVSWDCEPRVFLNTDPAMFRVVVRNLMDNAVCYADQGGTIRIGAFLTETQYELSVVNSGCVLLEQEAEHVFEPLWRADPARSDTGTHAGLGLALCRRILNVLGGAISASVQRGDFCVLVAFDLKQIEIASVGHPGRSDSGTRTHSESGRPSIP